MRETAEKLVSTVQRRSSVLTYIFNESTENHNIIEDLSSSRSTVDRALDECRELGLLDPEADRIEPTLFARLVVAVYNDFDARVASLGTQQESNGDPLWATDAEQREALQLVTDRLDLLTYARSPRYKRDFVEELPHSRSTVDRAIRELEVAGLVQRTSDGYTTTPIGRWTVDQYRTTLETLADVVAAQDVLDQLPADCPFSPALLAGADTERTDAAAPYRLPNGVQERLDAAEQIRMVLPLLANPQLLDCCHQQVVSRGASLELIMDRALSETLTSEFPGAVAEMAAARTGEFQAFLTEVPAFGMVLTETPAGASVSVIVYADHWAVYGAIHTQSEAAIAWAEEYYEHHRTAAKEHTDTLRDAPPRDTTPALSAVTDPGRVEREAEGFVRLTPTYFAQRAPTAPATGWRTGFDLVDVHAGYAIERERTHDGTRHTITEALVDSLRAGTDRAVVGPPGSGKSTVCKTVACRWYEQGLGAVFYRASGTGTTFDSPAILREQLRTAAADGHALVVVEDAVRAEANAIFRVMRAFRGTENVTFLLDAREGEWENPTAFPPDARLDADRTEHVETLSIPPLDDRDCERLVEQFQNSVSSTTDVSVEHLLREIDTAADERLSANRSQPHKLLLLLHRLVLHTDPLVGEDAQTPTTLAEDVQRTYEELATAGEMALDVGVLVNLLNAAGLGVRPAFVYALADEEPEIEAVHSALSVLEERVIFEPVEEDPGATRYRTVHEVWSRLFLDHLLDATAPTSASRRFGRCVSALLALVDDESRRERVTAAVPGKTPAIDRILDAPEEWADRTTERIFHLGLDRPGLAVLFGRTERPQIELPAACSPEMEPRCAAWRGEMYFERGDRDRAKQELDRAVDLVEAVETKHVVDLTDVSARTDRYLGSFAFLNGDVATAREYFEHARERYHAIDDRSSEANCYNILGTIALDRGDLDRAERCLEQALDTHREVGGQWRKEDRVRNNLGIIAMRRGKFDRATEHLERGIEIHREREQSYRLAFLLASLGEITRLRGDLEQAEDYCKQGLDVARDAGATDAMGRSVLRLGRIEIDRGDLDAASECLQRSLDTSRESENKRRIARSHRGLGTVARERGALGAAENHLEDSLEICREGDHRYDEGKTLVELGTVDQARNHTASARERFGAAVEIYREMGAVRDDITCLKQLTKICEAVDETETALDHCETAVTLAKEAGFDELYASLTERHTQLVEP